MKLKQDWIIGFMNKDGTYKYVTSIDNVTKEYLCEDNKPALRMIESRAKNLAYCIHCNGASPVLMAVPHEQGSFVNSNEEATDRL